MGRESGTRYRRVRAAAFACLVGLSLTACGVADREPRSVAVPTATTEEDTAARAEVTYLPECGPDSLVKRPSSYVLACADGGEMLEDLSWRAWGEDSATATGNLIANDCLPSCAEGSDVRTPVKVIADQLVEGESSASYRRLTVSQEGPGGEGTQTVYTLPEAG